MSVTGDKEYFKGIKYVNYEGPESTNPFAYRYYNPNQLVLGKKMGDHFKFAVAYWHTFGNTGGDPFGPGTKLFPWDISTDPVQRGRDKMDAAFEFISKLGLKYFCFHDFDLVNMFARFHIILSLIFN